MSILEDILRQDDPISWVLDNLQLAERGSNAYVFDHPERPDAVIRITEDCDGWYLYAMRLDDRDERSPHSPIVHELATFGGIYGAVVERLHPVTNETIAAAIEDFSARRPSGLPASLLEFIADCPVPVTDTREDNWMMRGDVVVLNDPYGTHVDDFNKDVFVGRYGLPVLVPAP